jgi:hypothetical protein
MSAALFMLLNRVGSCRSLAAEDLLVFSKSLSQVTDGCDTTKVDTESMDNAVVYLFVQLSRREVRGHEPTPLKK